MKCITISIRLPKATNPNGRSHWAKKARDTKTERRAAQFDTRAALGRNDAPKWTHGKIEVTWFARHPTHLPDHDNAEARTKTYRDGICDAGVFVNDKNVETVLVARLIDKDSPRVLLSITGWHEIAAQTPSPVSHNSFPS